MGKDSAGHVWKQVLAHTEVAFPPGAAHDRMQALPP